MSMKLLRGLQQIPAFIGGIAATIGNFDGVHRGHQALLNQLFVEAGKRKLPVVVILFDPQPGEFFHGNQAPPRLASLREKLAKLADCQVDYVYCLKFDQKLAQMAADDFARHYLFSLLKIKYLLIGEDFRFGRNRQGNTELLKKLASEANGIIDVYPSFKIINERVSSTSIRAMLSAGNLAAAKEMLGSNYSLCGRVVQGQGRGKQWGIPTANIKLKRLVLPMTGVFCVQIKRAANQRLLNGVANLGCRPTVDGYTIFLEVNIFDFNEDLYGEMLQVIFIDKLREEIKFPTIDALIEQIQQDIAAAKAKLASCCLTNSNL